MILMLEGNSFYEIMGAKGYQPLKNCLKLASSILGINKNEINLQKLHDIFVTIYNCNNSTKLYHTEGNSEFFNYSRIKDWIDEWPQNPNSYCNKIKNWYFNGIPKNLEIILQPHEVNFDNAPLRGGDTIPCKWEAPKRTEPWDETNMDYCNQQLLDKYQFESKRKIKITEEQLLKLKELL